MERQYNFTKKMVELLLSFELRNEKILKEAGIFNELYKITELAFNEQEYRLNELIEEFKDATIQS